LIPLNAPLLKDREIFENVSVVELNVNDPDTVDPELPPSFSLEKLSCESAKAGRHTSARNTAQTLDKFKYRRITTLDTAQIDYSRECTLNFRLVKNDNSCNRLQTFATLIKLGQNAKRTSGLGCVLSLRPLRQDIYFHMVPSEDIGRQIKVRASKTGFRLAQRGSAAPGE